MALGPEYMQVERPLIEQLKGMGWRHLEGAPPGRSGRPILPPLAGNRSPRYSSPGSSGTPSTGSTAIPQVTPG